MEARDTEVKTGGKASKKYADKMSKLSEHCWAPRYVKFFVCPFKEQNEDGSVSELDPYTELEDEISAWINDGMRDGIGYDMLSVSPQVTYEEVTVTVLYRRFKLY